MGISEETYGKVVKRMEEGKMPIYPQLIRKKALTRYKAEKEAEYKRKKADLKRRTEAERRRREKEARDIAAYHRKRQAEAAEQVAIEKMHKKVGTGASWVHPDISGGMGGGAMSPEEAKKCGYIWGNKIRGVILPMHNAPTMSDYLGYLDSRIKRGDYDSKPEEKARLKEIVKKGKAKHGITTAPWDVLGKTAFKRFSGERSQLSLAYSAGVSKLLTKKEAEVKKATTSEQLAPGDILTGLGDLSSSSLIKKHTDASKRFEGLSKRGSELELRAAGYAGMQDVLGKRKEEFAIAESIPMDKPPTAGIFAKGGIAYSPEAEKWRRRAATIQPGVHNVLETIFGKTKETIIKGGKGWEEQIMSLFLGKYRTYKKIEKERIGVEGYDITPTTLKKAGEGYTELVSVHTHTFIGGKKQKDIVAQEKITTEAYEASKELINPEWIQPSGELILPIKEIKPEIEAAAAIDPGKYTTPEGYYKKEYIEYTPESKKYVTAYETYEVEQAKLKAMPKPHPIRRFGMGAGTMIASVPGFVAFEAPRIAAETVIKPTEAPGKIATFGVGMYGFAKAKPIEFAGSLAAMWALGGFKTPYARGKIAQPTVVRSKLPSGATAYSIGIKTKTGETFFGKKPYQEYYPTATFTRGLPKIGEGGKVIGIELGKPMSTTAEITTSFAKANEGYIAGSRGIYYQMPKKTVRYGADTDIYFAGKTKAQVTTLANKLQTQLGRNYEVRISKGGNAQIFNKVTGKQVVDMLTRKVGQDKIVFKDGIPVRYYNQILRDKRQIVKHVKKSDPKYSKAVADLAKTEAAIAKGEGMIKTGISFKRYPVTSFEQLFGVKKGQWLPESPFETKMVSRISGIEKPIIAEARGTRYFTIGSKVAAKEVRSGIIEILEREKVPNVNKVADTIIRDLKKYDAELYGSLIQQQAGKAIGKPGLGRVARDIDVHVKTTGYSALFKGERFTSEFASKLIKGHPRGRNSIISGKTDRLQFHHIVKKGKGETGVLMTYGEHLAIEVAMGHLGKPIGANTLFYRLFRQRNRITNRQIQNILKNRNSKRVQNEISNILKEVEKIDKKTPQFGEVVIHSINKAAGKKVIALKVDIHGNKTPTMIRSGEKLFDIHAKETPGYAYGGDYLGWGLTAEKMVKSKEGIPGITLSEQASRKFRGAVQARSEPFYIIEGKSPRTGVLEIMLKPARIIEKGKGLKDIPKGGLSIGTKVKEGVIIRGRGRLLPEHGGRFKDIADYYFAEKANIAGLIRRGKKIDAKKADAHLEKWTDAWGTEIAKRTRDAYKEALKKGEPVFLGEFGKNAPVRKIDTYPIVSSGFNIRAMSKSPSISPLTSDISSLSRIPGYKPGYKPGYVSPYKSISSEISSMSRMPSYKPSSKPPSGKISPYVSPYVSPSVSPYVSPSVSPSVSPYVSPYVSPSVSPSVSPYVSPSVSPYVSPYVSPSVSPYVSSKKIIKPYILSKPKKKKLTKAQLKARQRVVYNPIKAPLEVLKWKM